MGVLVTTVLALFVNRCRAGELVDPSRARRRFACAGGKFGGGGTGGGGDPHSGPIRRGLIAGARTNRRAIGAKSGGLGDVWGRSLVGQ